MDGCEKLTKEQLDILLNHIDNAWNRQRMNMKPPENKTPRKNRCRFCLELIGKRSPRYMIWKCEGTTINAKT